MVSCSDIKKYTNVFDYDDSSDVINNLSYFFIVLVFVFFLSTFFFSYSSHLSLGFQSVGIVYMYKFLRHIASLRFTLSFYLFSLIPIALIVAISFSFLFKYFSQDSIFSLSWNPSLTTHKYTQSRSREMRLSSEEEPSASPHLILLLWHRHGSSNSFAQFPTYLFLSSCHFS